MRCYLFDLDGTLADLSHRLHHIKPEGEGKKDWDAFYAACVDDKPIPHMVAVLKAIAAENTIVYVSGRSDRCREQTADWIEKHELPTGQLYMRKEGDFRADHVVKGEILDQMLADGLEPVMAFDDRSQVVQAWRARGIPCAQVAEGNY